MAAGAREDVHTKPVLHELAERRVLGPVLRLVVALGHHALAPRGARREHSTVEHLVGARARHERAEPLEEGVGAHRDPPRAVLPGALELQGHLVRGQEAQAPIGQRGAEQVAAEILEALAVVTAHLGGCFQVEAAHAGLAFAAGLAVVVGVDGFWCVLARAASRGGAREGQAQCPLVGVVVVQSASLEELLHALRDGGAERLELVLRGRNDGREGTEHVVHAIEKQHVKVNVQREVAPEPLHGGDAACAWVEDAEGLALVAIPSLDHARGHAVHRERELVSIGQRYAQLEGEREHPLAYAHTRQHGAHPVPRHLGHPSTEAARAEASAFAREPHQAVRAAVLAREAHCPMCEYPTPQVAAQLVHHEAGHRLAGLAASPQEGLEVLAQHAMQHRLLRVVRRGVLARGAARRCRAGRHAAPAGKRRYGPRGAEPRRIRASAGGLAAAWRRMSAGAVPYPIRRHQEIGQRSSSGGSACFAVDPVLESVTT